MELARTIHPGPDGIRLRPRPVRDHILERIAGLHPAYFAFVMATGIVAIGAHHFGLTGLAWVLSRINWVAYPVLWLLLAVRTALFPKRVWADCTSHERAPGFFTIVAATSIVGIQCTILHDSSRFAAILWWLAVGLWVVTIYGVFSLLITSTKKPPLSKGINGGWLVSIVATQSVVVLGCSVGSTGLLGDIESTLFMLLCFWLFGGVLYLWIMAFIFYRYLFFEFSPGDLMPPYWINMGAVAISTLAGALLLFRAEHSLLLEPMLPFIKGLTVVYWANASWWIPMLLVLGAWRHLVKGFPIVYDPLYWGLVFPLGMYAVCTMRLGDALGTQILTLIAKLFIVAAAVVWVFTFLGLIRRKVFILVLAFRQLRNPRFRERARVSAPQEKEIKSDEYHKHPERV